MPSGSTAFPISDQALLAVRKGERSLFVLREQGDGADSSAPAGLAILGDGELDLVVAPGARGRGIATAALTAVLDISDHESEGSDGDLRAWARGENPAATGLLGRAGFEPIRSLYRLALDPDRLPDAIAGSRGLPERFRVSPFEAGDPEQVEAWVRVNAAAFATHPEQGRVTRADFTELTREPWFDAADLLLAFDEGAAPDAAGGAVREGSGSPAGSPPLAGYTWIKTTRGAEGTETELYVLGVDPGYAGRGLGAALLGATLRRMLEHDPDRITLYVDGDNENARALYDRAGFETDQLSTQWLRRRSARPTE